MEVEYKGNTIKVTSFRLPESDRWSAKVIVNNGERIDAIDGATAGYASEREAEAFGLELARQWIDDGKPPLTTEYGC
jgi:hypothetical protein